MSAARLSLVTGGSGFIGGHLVRMLAARGARVRSLDLAAPAQALEGVEAMRGSICDRATVRAALDGAEHVYHLAANPDLWARDKSEFKRVNLDGSRIVLEEAARSGAHRIVYCSTESILKSLSPESAARTESDLSDLSVDDMPGPYTRSKFLAEREAFAAALGGAPVVVVNPTLPVGPGDRRLTPPTRMLLGYLNGGIPAYLDFAMNLVDVRHVAFGHILAAERGTPGERYILGGVNLRLGELLAALEEITGRTMPRRRIPYAVAYAFAFASEFIADHVMRHPPVAPLTGVRLARSPLMFDSTKAHHELGLPATDLRRTLMDAVIWLQGRGLIHRRLPKLYEAGMESAL